MMDLINGGRKGLGRKQRGPAASSSLPSSPETEKIFCGARPHNKTVSSSSEELKRSVSASNMHAQLHHLQSSVHDMVQEFGKREKQLLAQIAFLHHQLQSNDTLSCFTNSIQVNGVDVGFASAEDIQNALDMGDEPITVQISGDSCAARNRITSGTQTRTSESNENEQALEPLLTKRQSTRKNRGHLPVDPVVMQQLELAVEAFIDETDLEDEPLGDVEYEEVTLKRSTSKERLGLTLCYGSGEDIETDIFISEIERNSVAARDARIQAGDQILQVNGQDLHTRNQAIELFRQERQDITLLLARPIIDKTSMLDCGGVLVPSLSPMPEQVTAEEEESAGSAQEKDSGISRATDSEPECAGNEAPVSSPSCGGASTSHSFEILRPFSGKTFHTAFASFKQPEASPSSTVTATPTDSTFKPVGRSESHVAGTSSVLSSPGSEAPPSAVPSRLTRSDSDGSLQHELATLSREMETIKLECDRLIAQHASDKKRARERLLQAQTILEQDLEPRMRALEAQKMSAADGNAPAALRKESTGQLLQTFCTFSPPIQRMARAIDAFEDSPLSTPGLRRSTGIQHALHRCKDTIQPFGRDDTSSAYNTGGESCRSTPANMDNTNNTDPQQIYTTLPRTSPLSLAPASLRPPCSPSPCKAKSPQAKPPPPCPFQMGDVMYTNPANLQNTILMQQRMLRQAMIQQAKQLQSSLGNNGPLSTEHLYDTLMPVDEQVEWKVKRRSDGSRYIIKRPVRNKLLKERAQQLHHERQGGSTDDDAMSELKIGRYWSREEKKKHMERAKERKKRQEEVIRWKQVAGSKHVNQPILQLSHKKQMRKKPAQLLDRYTTIQEYLAHGNRQGENNGLGLLSVTTV